MHIPGAFYLLAGIACLSLCVYAVYTIAPREGRPQSAWTRTEARSTVLTLALLVLFVFGIGLFVKGIFV